MCYLWRVGPGVNAEHAARLPRRGGPGRGPARRASRRVLSARATRTATANDTKSHVHMLTLHGKLIKGCVSM